MKRISMKEGLDVKTMSNTTRRAHNLATSTTIIEICGDDGLMQEMYEYCKAKKIVGYDSETTGLNFFKDRMVLAQIGDFDRQYLIWLDHTNPEMLLRVLRDPDIVKIGLNLKFDLTFGLFQYGFKRARASNVVDVMLTAQVLMCGIYDNVGLTLATSSMETQARHWLGLAIPKDKELRVGWEGWDPNSLYWQESEDRKQLRKDKILYAADDVCIPLSIAYKHKPWIQYLELTTIVNLENRFLPVLSDIEARGLPFDQEAWMQLAYASEQGAKDARHKLDALFNMEVTVAIDHEGNAHHIRDKNYTSNEQVMDLIREWIYENCGVDVISNNRHFKESLERVGMPKAYLDRMFKEMMLPDPNDPKKKKKRGYPKMKDILMETWPMYKDRLAPGSYILESTDAQLLKFYKTIYDAPDTLLEPDSAILNTTIGLPSVLVDPLLALRGDSKNASTYGRNWLQNLGTDGRVYTNFIQAALSTGRLSSSPNTMNFPADAAYRACFKASEGFKMIGADYSQIEPRVIAHLSQDPTYMRVFWSEAPGTPGFDRWCDESVTEELDLYTEVGKRMGLIPPYYTKQDTKGNEALNIPPKPEGAKGRKQAKVANLGLGYGTGRIKFHYMLCIDTQEYHSFAETVNLYDTYWAAMHTVKAYLDQSSAYAHPEKSERKTIHPYVLNAEVTWAETISGRKRFFRSDNPTWWTQGRNMPIQGTAGGDMLKMAALELTEWAWDNDIEGGLVNLIHDELLAEVREDQAEMFAEAMRDCMVKVGQNLCPSVPITADTYIEDFWKKD